MKLDIDGVQAFTLIAALGSFQKAAERLRLTQTALTRRLQRLESYLGVRLLDRTTRSVALTVVGREFLPQAERLVTELTQAVHRLKDISRRSSGDISIACITSMSYQWLPSMLHAYAQKHPGNRVRIIDRTGTMVTEAVKRGQAEFGISVIAAGDADLIEEPILQDPFVLFCLKSHPLGGLKRATWKDLNRTDLITYGGASGNRLLINYQLTRKRLETRGRFEVEQLSTAIGLVSAGLGVAILPSSTLLAATYPEIRQIPLVNPVVKRAIGLIRRRGTTLSPPAQAFYDLVARALRSSGSRSATK